MVMLDAMVPNQPPALVHIVASVLEGSGGAYLDFASTTQRLESMGAEASYGEEVLITANLLIGLFAGMSQSPFVILDITHPYNRAEAIRMLLSRNNFRDRTVRIGNDARRSPKASH
jgi:hypothetical protein